MASTLSNISGSIQSFGSTSLEYLSYAKDKTLEGLSYAKDKTVEGLFLCKGQNC